MCSRVCIVCIVCIVDVCVVVCGNCTKLWCVNIYIYYIYMGNCARAYRHIRVRRHTLLILILSSTLVHTFTYTSIYMTG